MALAEVRVDKQPPEPRSKIWFRRRISLRSALREAWRYRELTLTLAERDLRVRYKQAFLGFAWAVFTPVMLMLIFTFLFTKFGRVDSSGLPYPLFAYLGLIPWTFFSSAVLSGGMSLVSNMSILNKVYCPREVFPTGSDLRRRRRRGCVEHRARRPVHCRGLRAKAGSALGSGVLPGAVMFALGVTLGVSALLVYVRDLRHALPLLVQFWLFATPVAYGALCDRANAGKAPALLGDQPARAGDPRAPTHGTAGSRA